MAEQEMQVEEQEKVQMPTQNGVRRPKPGTATGRVWEICDEVSEATGEPATRAAVLEIFVGEGGNPATGATQHGRWRKFHGLVSERAATAAGSDAAVEE